MIFPTKFYNVKFHFSFQICNMAAIRYNIVALLLRKLNVHRSIFLVYLFYKFYPLFPLNP